MQLVASSTVLGNIMYLIRLHTRMHAVAQATYTGSPLSEHLVFMVKLELKERVHSCSEHT